MKKIYTLFLGLILIGSAANSQTIFAIQNTTIPNGDSPLMGNVVTTSGVVTAVVLNGSAAGTFFIQDGAGPWNGIYIFESGTPVSIGDNVSVTGTVLEFNNTTELGSVSNITINSTGNTLPAASVISTLNANTEDYEGVLVQVQNAAATSVGTTLGFGLWEVNDGSGGIQVDDDIFPYALSAVLSNIYSVTGPVQYSFGTFKILPRTLSDIGGAPAPTIVPIFDIQNTVIPNGDSPQLGNVLTTKGVVTAVMINSFPGTFFIQDGNGAWNGVYVFESGTPVAIGDSVMVTGEVQEFNNLTEIGFVSNVTVLNSGNTLPAPVVISTSDAASMEEYEGVLVRVLNATHTINPGNNGLWIVDDGSGGVEIDDEIFPYAIPAVISTAYNVTGVATYSFSMRRIYPRDINDISIFTSVEELGETRVASYPNPVKNNITFELDINGFSVSIFDITGKIIKTKTSENKTLTISSNEMNNGVYFYSVSNNNGELITTNKFIVAR
jgi:Secretion system C-terminal sorting domain